MPNPESTLGHRASPSLLAELFKSGEAKLPTISLEGVPLLTVFTRSDITGWAVAAGIAEDTLIAPLVRRLAVTTIVGLGLLLLSLAFALRLATRLARANRSSRFWSPSSITASATCSRSCNRSRHRPSAPRRAFPTPAGSLTHGCSRCRVPTTS
jgi:hypothetical protein